jgi:hypothetical protein
MVSDPSCTRLESGLSQAGMEKSITTTAENVACGMVKSFLWNPDSAQRFWWPFSFAD